MLDILIIGNNQSNSIWNKLYIHLNIELGKSFLVKNDLNDIFLYEFRIILFLFIGKIVEYNIDPSLLTDRITFLKSLGAKIIYVMHDIMDLRGNKKIIYMESYLQSFSDIIIHLGGYSKDFLLQNSTSINILHKIIPHPNYDIKNTITKFEARSTLGIPNNAKVILSFGHIRSYEEMSFLISVFKGLNLDAKYLLTSRKNFGNNKILYKIRDYYYSFFFKDMQFNERFIPDNELQVYFNASDLVFLPRIRRENLNSGVLILAFTFGKIVVGPSDKVYGNILKETGNPTFDSIDKYSAINALSEGMKKLNTPLGDKNREYASLNWSFEKIFGMYLDLIVDLLKQSK